MVFRGGRRGRGEEREREREGEGGGISRCSQSIKRELWKIDCQSGGAGWGGH